MRNFIIVALSLVFVTTNGVFASAQEVETPLRVATPAVTTVFTGDLVGNVYAINGSKISLLYTFEVKSSETEVAIRRIAHRVRADGRVELTVLTDDQRWVALVLNQARTKVVETRGPFEAQGEEALLVTKQSVQTGGENYMELVDYDRRSGVVQSSASLERVIGMARFGRDMFALQRGVGLVLVPRGDVEQAQVFGNVHGTAMAIARSGRMIFVLHGSWGDTPGGIEVVDARTGETKWALKSVMANTLGLPYGRVLGFSADSSAVYLLSYQGNTTQIIAIPYVKNYEGQGYFEYPTVVAESSAMLCGLDVVR